MHIIEPTLKNQTGHCYSLVNDLLSANNSSQTKFHLWINRYAESLFRENKNIIEHRYFARRIRRLQVLWLYRRLIKKQQAFFVSTATSTDLLLVSWALKVNKNVNLNLVKLYVHWLYRSSSRIKRLQKIAQRYPQLPIACPTESVKIILIEAGFTNVEIIPYPSAKHIFIDHADPAKQVFEKLLFAGAARVDKGFPLMVELISLLKREKSEIPITLQCSTTHKGKHASEVQAALIRLKDIDYKNLEIKSETLSSSEYQQMFANSIVIQPYQVDLFADRVSGVSLDALKEGSPLVVPANTWMAQLVERFQAGVVVEQTADIQEWLAAVKQVIANWPEFAKNASLAGQELQAEHAPDKLMAWLSHC